MESGWQPLAVLSIFAILVLVPFVSAGNAVAQGCGMSGHGGKGGAHGASQGHALASTDVMPVWNSILFSHVGLDRAIAAMSIPDAVYYGGLLRDDFKSLKGSSHVMSLGMDGLLESANSRVKQLTKQIPKSLKANDQAAAVTAFENLDAELERVIAIFPSTAIPTDFSAKFRSSDFRGTTAPVGPAEIAVPAPAVKYACPMHPEVASTQAGNCPQCGMVLEKLQN